MSFTPKRITMLIVSMALFMDVLDSNVINTAVPAMSYTFQVNPINLKIALISYLLSLAIFIPMSGWTADKYGAKNIFIAALGLFTVASFFCGYAESLTFLVVARFIQGIGGAFMISLGRLLVARSFKRHELVEATNTIIIVVSIAAMVGPFVGGVIVDHLSWPWIFWLNIPAGFFVMIIAKYHLKDTTLKNPHPFDFLGFILFGGSLAIFSFSLSEMSESHRHIESALMRLVIALMMMIAYFIHAKHKHFPVIKTELFRLRTFRVSILANLCTRLGFGGIPFLLPLLQQLGLGFSAQLSGLLLMPIALGIIFSKLMALKVLRRLGYKKYLLINTVLVGFILWVFQFITIHTSEYLIASLTFIFGILISAQYTGMNSLALADVKDDELSSSNSITSTIQILSQSLGVAVGAILLRIYLNYPVKTTSLTPTIFHHAFFTLGIITIISSLIFTHLKSGDGKQMLIKSDQ